MAEQGRAEEKKHYPDFFCIEVHKRGFSTRGKDNELPPNTIAEDFDVFITKHSQVERKDILDGTSMLITSPEFKDFMRNTELGKRTAEELETGGRKNIGFIDININHDGIYYDLFMPFGAMMTKHSYAPEMNGRGLGALIDARILKDLQKQYPTKQFSYGLRLTGIREERLRKRGLPIPVGQYIPVGQQYYELKKFLVQKRNEKLTPGWLEKLQRRADNEELVPAWFKKHQNRKA